MLMFSLDASNIKKYIKYCIVGGTGSILDFAIYTLLIIFFNLNYLVANIFSFSVGTIVVCYLQKNWTFKYENKKDRTLYIRYLLSIAIVYLFNNLLLIILISGLNISSIFAKVIQSGLSAILGYITQKTFVFKENSSK